jgi:hypothetical protein
MQVLTFRANSRRERNTTVAKSGCRRAGSSSLQSGCQARPQIAPAARLGRAVTLLELATVAGVEGADFADFSL